MKAAIGSAASTIYRIIAGGAAAVVNYLRPDGTSSYLRPDGTSFYLRP